MIFRKKKGTFFIAYPHRLKRDGTAMSVNVHIIVMRKIEVSLPKLEDILFFFM